jgi:hypothetical protein
MPRVSSFRVIVISLTLAVFASIAVSANWSRGFGFSLSTASKDAEKEPERTAAVSQPRITTTPLNAISSFDAAVVTRHIVGAFTLPTINHLCAADTTGNGAIAANDPSLIGRYAVGLTGTGLTGTVVPPPCHANYATTIPVLKGDVTGQVPVITGGVSGTVAVSIPAVSATPGTVLIPINIGNTAGMDISSYDLQITFDPAVITPAAVPVDTPGTLSSTMSVTANASNSGHLIVGAYRSSALSGSGTLLNLRFNIIGGAGQSTALTFEDYTDPGGRAHQGFLFNEGTPSAALTNGSATIPAVSPTATSTATGTPTPTTPLNAITSFDSAVILRHIAGTNPLPTIDHLCAAEVDNDGLIVANDVRLIGWHTSGKGTFGTVGTVVQPPCSGQWPTTVPVLKGDVTGQDPVITGGMPGTIPVSLPAVISPPGSILIPVTVGNTTGMDISSYDLQITYDRTLLSPQLQSFTIDQTGTISSAMTFYVNDSTNPGHLIVAAAQAAPLTGSGALLNLRFNLIGTPGSSTNLTFANYTSGQIHQSFLFNEGTPSAETANGSVFISSSSPTATSTPTGTATATPTNTPFSTLGIYPDTVTELSGNITVTPGSPPANASSMSVTSDANFMGRLEGDPVTGVVRVTDANPGGMHLITVRAFDVNGNSATRTFPLTVITTPPCTPVAFASPASYSGVGVDRSMVAVGDFNRDGKQDLVISDESGGKVSVLLGDGGGTFGAPANFAIGGFPQSVAVGDLNGDGKQDLIVANGYFVVIRLGDGTGNFGAPTSVYGGESPGFATVGDFNNDGRQDLAVAHPYHDLVSILLGDGTGGFGPPASFGFGARPSFLAVGDFNHDGNQDLAAANTGGTIYRALWILLGNGRGGFAASTDYQASQPQSLAIGNFNGDANQDLLADGAVIPGDGIGGFGFATFFGNGGNANAVGDFNGDLKQDFVGAGGGGVGMYLGNGSGGFGTQIRFYVGNYLRSVAVGDFNGDGYQDIAATDDGGGVGSPGVWILMRDCSGLTTSIEGTVTYRNSASPRPVSNVRIQGTGSPGIATLSDFPSGSYTLTGFGPGPYTLAPDLTGQENGAITSFDAARIAQHVTGAVLLNANQLPVADVSGNGTLNSFDAAQVARYVAALPPFGSTGTWRFDPVSRSYGSVSTNVVDEDYKALLMGEVSGNWANTAARPKGTMAGGHELISTDERTEERRITATAQSVVSNTGKEIFIPVNVAGVAGKEIISYEFDLIYDPLVIQPFNNPVDVTGTSSRGFSVVTNPSEPGLLRVVAYGPMPIGENGVLLNLRFVTVGSVGSVSPLTFERMMFNEDESEVTLTNGRVELF